MLVEKRVETLKKVKSKQVIWREWMQKAAEGIKDKDKVVAYINVSSHSMPLIAFYPLK
jgi:hypothetical protein